MPELLSFSSKRFMKCEDYYVFPGYSLNVKSKNVLKKILGKGSLDDIKWFAIGKKFLKTRLFLI